MSGFDIIDPERGIFVTAHAGRAAVVFDHEAVLAAGPASDALGGEMRSLNLGDDVSLSVEIEFGEPSARIAGDGIPEERLTICRASGRLHRGAEEAEIACPAISVASVAEGMSEASRRSIAIVLSDGGLVAISGVRPPGAEAHGDERIVAVLAEPPRSDEESAGEEGPAREIRFEEVLLSTEYDSDGRQRRATLELWPPGESGKAAVRGAGTIVCGTTLEVDGARIDTAFFRWSIEGRPGLGRYEIVSPA